MQQVQAAAACADEDEIGGVLVQRAAVQIGKHPFAFCGAVDGGNVAVETEGCAVLRQIGAQAAGEFAEVYVCAVCGAGGGNGFARCAALHHQGQPLAQGCLVFGVFHAGEQGMGG